MDPPDQDVLDAEMKAMMGFSSFGMQPGAKKQKTAHIPVSHDHQPLTHHFGPPGQTSPSDPPQSLAQSHSVTVDTTASQGAPSEQGWKVGKSQAAPTDLETPKSAFPTGVPIGIFDKLTWKELEAYRKGVKDENGDLAWFLPSFIEDPWAKLEKQLADRAPNAGKASGNGIGSS